MRQSDVLIVGGGHGGTSAAIALRQRHYHGSITVVSEEPDLPYERPPLSKEYLAGEKPFERIMLRPAPFWSEKQIELQLARRVVDVDAEQHVATTFDGQAIRYGTLIWAAGGTPRTLSCDGADLAGVYAIRTRADVDALNSALPQSARVVVIGGGYIGLEAAATLRKRGFAVVLLEALDQVLKRVAGEPIARFFEAEHRTAGVNLQTGVTVRCLEGRNGKVTGVRLSDGASIPANVVVTGIGIMPSIDTLARAGAAIRHGIEVDPYCRTSLDDVFAIGDCATHQNAYADGAWVRLESVQNASDQARTVANFLVGTPQPYRAVPWFWSNQYDLKLQTVGLSAGHDDFVLRGDPSNRSFSIVYLRSKKVVALDCVNDVKNYSQGRRLVEDGLIVPKSDLADPDLSLKTIWTRYSSEMPDRTQEVVFSAEGGA